MDQLHEDIQAVGCAEDLLQQRAREERRRVDELRAELEKRTAQESRLPPESEKLSQQLSQGRALVAQREASCETSLSSKNHKLAELDKGCSLYRQRLGLQFERVGEERLRLTFINIDANDPMRPFFFQVGYAYTRAQALAHAPRVPASRRLTPTECLPALLATGLRRRRRQVPRRVMRAAGVRDGRARHSAQHQQRLRRLRTGDAQALQGARVEA